MTDPIPSGAAPSLLRQPAFVCFLGSRVLSVTAYQMQTVAIGWQIYELTGSALDLGLVGLVQFVPFVLLSLLVGHFADGYDRRGVVRLCQAAMGLLALALAAGTASGEIGRGLMFGLLLLIATARTFEIPTMHALLPGLVPAAVLPRAIAASASANQAATICGPALGGLIYAFGATTVYALCAALFAVAATLATLIPPHVRTAPRQKLSLQSLMAGLVYLRGQPVLLGVVTLDLVVVLFGGVTALLPIFARDILLTGPWGLGLLRAAPAVGALAVTAVLARRAPDGRLGLKLFAATAVFGAATVVFALSTSLALSLAALAVYGAADATSVVIRQGLIQTRTPNAVLGRVMAVNSMFTGTTGTLGDFRAGAVAAGTGPVASALVGGVGAIVLTLVWMRLVPPLARIERFAPDDGPDERAA
ncbi:MFS transporter [Rhodoplanes sp. TEM]|uniref:MFS transporter n=1 Tax=Rhodoplanes tepidamans TaxID=200616 RepID=A0ABT5JB30_RHOTP|nr:MULTISPECIES: MFS transporter [Rhodoplanes]MDC7786758.1 MFS transporter [Rhodoplanes tepidamans]MDC7983764.1 MFS transporter [Rhodoplanes sp. TEM]MDQ0358195.1 MFS family permease [Rhodoplanes tepidamans]